MPSSDAFVYSACPFVSFVVKSLSQRRTPSNSNQYVFRRSDAASNRDFERGFEGPSGVGALNFHVLRVPIPVTANYLPVMAKLSPCYCPVTRAPPIFAQPIVIEMDFPAKTGPETANSPCFPPVIREYQGESGRQAPLQPGLDPAELASLVHRFHETNPMRRIHFP